MKIIAVGLNYRAHVEEFNGVVPSEPVIFMKPDSALLLNNKPFFIPHFSDNVQYETEVLIRINRLGKHISEKFAHRYYSEIGLGIDFTARDLQTKLRNQGHPWEVSKAFDGSAVVGDFIPIGDEIEVQNLPFHLHINGEKVQCGHTKEMIFSVDQIIAYVSRFFTLKIGDIIFTGTPVGVGSVKQNDLLEGYLNGRKMFSFRVK